MNRIIFSKANRPCHSEDFEGIDTLTLQVRYDMPSKSEVNLWAGISFKKNQNNYLMTTFLAAMPSLAVATK